MADNFDARDNTSGVSVHMRASDDGAAKAAVIVSEMLSPTAVFNRPADTNVYAAGDAVSDSVSAPTYMTFALMARSTGMGGLIVGAKLMLNEKPAIAAEFHLWLFHTSPTVQNDNAVFAPNTGDLPNCVGFLIFSPANMSDATGMRIYQATNVPMSFRTSPTSSLYGLLTTRTAYTPASGKNFKVLLDTIKET